MKLGIRIINIRMTAGSKIKTFQLPIKEIDTALFGSSSQFMDL